MPGGPGLFVRDPVGDGAENQRGDEGVEGDVFPDVVEEGALQDLSQGGPSLLTQEGVGAAEVEEQSEAREAEEDQRDDPDRSPAAEQEFLEVGPAEQEGISEHGVFPPPVEVHLNLIIINLSSQGDYP